MAGELRAPLVTVDPLAEGESSVRSPLVTVDPLAEGYSNVRQSWLSVDPLTEGFRNLRVSLLVVEALIPVWPEEYMSNDKFPGSLGSGSSLPGLAFTWHKRPRFNTNKREAASGVSFRNALMEYPIWEFEGTFELLRDVDSINNNEFKTLCGFFLSRKGRYDSFLFKDSDDYLVTNGTLGTGDAVTTMFNFVRDFGGFVEKIGQVDTDETIAVYFTINENHTIPATPGPYTITVTNAADFVEDLGVTKGGTPMVKVTGAPAAGQYSVNVGTGVYTFNATDENDAVVIRYRYDVAPADYTVTMPNRVVFDVAPALNTEISADFEFFFRCIFKEDMADFEKFADKFWELQTLEFESLPA